MCLKIRCDEESEKICKIFWELNGFACMLAVRVILWDKGKEKENEKQVTAHLKNA
jgi:hypothetical protein